MRQPDLLLLNDADLTYAKIRLDPRSQATALTHIATISDSLTRALLWGAAWDMTRDAEMSAADFVDLVLAGIGTETDSTAVSRLPTYARTAIEYYSAPHTRDGLRRRWESGVFDLLTSARAGSDHQLSFARALAATAHSPQVLEFLRELLTGHEPATARVAGLALDADLRWTLVTALARAGIYGEEDIATELAGDATISGQERAALARAGQPTPEAKAAAWRDAIERDDLPNETQRQVAAGFAIPGQGELLEPYLEKYLQAAETIWEAKGVQRAGTALELMFPMPLASPEALARVNSWLESSPANPAAKRYVREGADDMARALRAQARDRQQ